MQQKFGDEVGVEYFDLADPATRRKVAGVVDEIGRRRLRLPVVVIDGEFVGGGQIDYWEIAQHVGHKIESRRPAS